MAHLFSLIFAFGLTCMASSTYDLCGEESVPPDAVLSKPENTFEIYINFTQSEAVGGFRFCRADFETCDNCRIRVSYDTRFEFPECQPALWSGMCLPDCAYVILIDPDYKNFHQRRVSSHREVMGFETESKHLQVIGCSSRTNYSDVTATLRLISVEKVQYVSASLFEPVSQRKFTSPHFPTPYVRNEEYYTYVLQGSSQTEFITVIFDDWMLSPYSTIQFQGANVVNAITGENSRPYIVSSQSSLNMTFSTGKQRRFDGTSRFLGFSAVARFYNKLQEVPKFVTNCDHTFSTPGGIIHLNDAADGQNRDCIWIIKKLPNFDGVYLKIIRYKTRYEFLASCEYSLEVRANITSKSELQLNVRPNDAIPSYAFQLSEFGFYIRLKGCYFDDPVVVAYAMYTNDCDDFREYYKCENGRCIPDQLKCDTFDHCGDNSDEAPGMCGRFFSKMRNNEYSGSNVSNADSKFYNYSLSINVIIPLVVSIILGIAILCLLIILVRRCRRLSNSVYGRRPGNNHRRQPRGGQHRFWQNRGVHLSVTMSSGEHPPSYEDVIRSTPIGQLNMAFSWSPCMGGLTQPPSYEEATSPTSSTPPSIDNNRTAGINSICNGETSRNVTQINPLPVLTATLSASLCPEADLSLSSSSLDDQSYDSHQLDISTSSDSFTSVQQSLIPNSFTCDNHRAANLNKDSNSGTSSQRNSNKLGNGAAGILHSPAVKNSVNGVNLETNGSSMHRQKESTENHHPGIGKNKDSKNRCNDSHRVLTINRGVQEGAKDARHDRHSHSSCANGLTSRSKQDTGVADEGRSQDLQGVDCLHNKTWRLEMGRLQEDCGENFDLISDTDQGCSSEYNDSSEIGETGLNICSPRVSYNSRSQSCDDLSFGTSMSVADIRQGRLHSDKRYSYAGVGDVSVGRRYHNEGEDFACKPHRYVDDLLLSSQKNFGESYSARKHKNRAYESEVDYIPDNDYQMYRRRPGHSRSRKQNSDCLRRHSLSPLLEPVLENPIVETEQNLSLENDGSRNEASKCNTFTVISRNNDSEKV